MTHRGQSQTFASSLPTLLRLGATPGKISGILGCRHLPPLHAPAESSHDIADLDWSHCPLDLLGSPFFAAVVQLDRLAKISPLAGWPDRYAAWAVLGLMALRQHRGEG